MRRLVTAIILMGALSGVPGPIHAPAAAAPGAHASVGQVAVATDTVRVDGKRYLYVAGGYRTTTSEGKTITRGFAARGRCYTFKRRDFKITVCLASAKSRKISEDHFDFDPALRSARLSVKTRGKPTRVRWTGRGQPQPGYGPAADPEYGAFAWASVYRDAKARGTVLGRRIAFGGFDAWSFFDEGGDAFVSIHGRNAVWEDARGVVHVRSVTRRRI